MWYKNFINEDVYVIYGDSYNPQRATMMLCAIIEPDDIAYHSRCLKFKKDQDYVLIEETEVLQLLPQKWLEDEEHEYYYVIFRYGRTTRSAEHIYMTFDLTINSGDKVLTCCAERVGNVVRTGFFKKHDAPYPVEKTWLVTRKVSDERYPINYETLSNNMYLKYLDSRKQIGYIAQAESTYRGFFEWYIETVDKTFKNSTQEITSNTILNFLIDEFEGGFNYRDCGYEGDFLRRNNQLYNFFDSVWLAYLLAKYTCYDDIVFDAFKYMLVIYENGEFNEFLYDINLDKPILDYHIGFIKKFLDTHI